mmetsp:Transcript_25053/g.50856  ORF Transcript_25053/g.50856 Transcript_25053/m.50856 type:complete len:210 (-) Transcript_25053:259-888(-)
MSAAHSLAAATARSSAWLCRRWKTVSLVSSSELSPAPAATCRASAAVTRQLGSGTSLGLTTSIMRGGARAPKSTSKASSSCHSRSLRRSRSALGSGGRIRGERSALDGLGVVGLRLWRASFTDCEVIPRIVTAYCEPMPPPLPPLVATRAYLLSTIVAWTTLIAGECFPRLLPMMSSGLGASRVAAAAVAAIAASSPPPTCPEQSLSPV